MTIYIIIFLLAAFCFSRKQEGYLSYLLWLIMLAATIFRSENVGADTWTYLYGYAWDVDSGSHVFEMLNNLVYYNIYKFDWERRIILYVYGIITYLFLFLMSRKFEIRLSYLLFFFFLASMFIKGLNISRQLMTATIICFSIPFIYEINTRKSYLFFGFVALATMFHFSSFMFVFLYVFRFIRNIENTKLVVFSSIFGSLFILQLIPIDSIFATFLPEEYSDYSRHITNKNEVSILGVVARFIIMGIQLIILSKTESKYNVLFAFSITLICATMGMDFVIGRIFLVLELFSIIYIASIYSCSFYNDVNRVILAIYLFISIYFCYDSIVTNTTINNYQFFF